MTAAVFAEQRSGTVAVFAYQYPYAQTALSQGGGGRSNRRIEAMRQRDTQARNNQIIQAIVAMVISGALDEIA